MDYTFDNKDYDPKRFYLFHATKVDVVEKILQDGRLMPLGKERVSEWSPELDEEGDDDYTSKVFLSLVYPMNDFGLNIRTTTQIRCMFIFDVEAMHRDGLLGKDVHFCRDWTYGSYIDRICMKGSDSLKGMLNAWRRLDSSNHTINKKIAPNLSVYEVPQNEVALTLPEGLSLKYLKAIQYPLASNNSRKGQMLRHLLDTYKEYKWVYDLNELDSKHTFIDF
jgi:hypothetical protein